MDGNTPKLLESTRIERLVALLLLVASVFVAFLAFDAMRTAFTPLPPMGNVISVEGTGTVTAIPDVARVTFSVREEAESAADAQDAAAEKVNTALDLLDEFNVEEKDVKTTSYNVSPRYSRAQPCFNGYCPEYEQTVIGYTTSQTVSVTVRDTEQVGAVLSALGSAGVSNLSGPSFTIDDPDALYEEAREKAISEARTKAKTLAKDLGVRLVRVTGFWENDGYRYPYAFEEKAYSLGGDGAMTAPAIPQLPVGENEVSVTVSVSYEIR